MLTKLCARHSPTHKEIQNERLQSADACRDGRHQGWNRIADRGETKVTPSDRYTDDAILFVLLAIHVANLIVKYHQGFFSIS